MSIRLTRRAALASAATAYVAARSIAPVEAQGTTPQAAAPAPKISQVTSSDGVKLSVQEWGNPAGPPVILIHGFSQSFLSWLPQVSDPTLTSSLRLVTLDLRGHGLSDKPESRDAYQPPKAWGDDIKAVIDALGLERPVLVAWSMGGRVACDYLVTHGQSGISGINFVSAATTSTLNQTAPAGAYVVKMVAPDLVAQVSGTRAFLRACFERQPSADDFETLLTFNAMVPAPIRRNMLGRSTPYEEALKSLRLPALVTHGRKDRAVLLEMAEYTARTVPNSQVSFYEEVGHSPFWEDTPRFNAELLAFVRKARG